MVNSNKVLHFENEDDIFNPVIKSIALNHDLEKNHNHDSWEIEYLNSNNEYHMNFDSLKNQKLLLENNENYHSENMITSKTGKNFMKKFCN
jgi:hypothetical protein